MVRSQALLACFWQDLLFLLPGLRKLENQPAAIATALTSRRSSLWTTTPLLPRTSSRASTDLPVKIIPLAPERTCLYMSSSYLSTPTTSILLFLHFFILFLFLLPLSFFSYSHLTSHLRYTFTRENSKSSEFSRIFPNGHELLRSFTNENRLPVQTDRDDTDVKKNEEKKKERKPD